MESGDSEQGERTKSRIACGISRQRLGYARRAVQALAAEPQPRRSAVKLREEIENKLIWVTAVIDQTERRVLHGEEVPSAEKIVSIFETHTDIIVKDRRETHYGHRIYLARAHPDSSPTA